MPRHSKMSHKTISMNQNLKELLGLDLMSHAWLD